MTTTELATIESPSTDVDWWYVRAYPGSAEAMDEATRLLVPWLRDQARKVEADRWFFMRYFDLSGQHLRLRLRGSAAAVDRVQAGLGEVVALLAGLVNHPARPRLIEGAAFGAMAGPRRVQAGLYAPELAKYGGAAGAELAEQLFTESSAWYVETDLASYPPAFDRAALALAYLSALLPAALPGERTPAFWRIHQLTWGVHLRMMLPTRTEMTDRLAVAAGGMAAADDLVRSFDGRIGEQVARVVRTLDRADALHLPVDRAHLLMHYLHMDLNRWGFMPAEECLLGIAAAQAIPLVRDKETHR